MKIHLIIFSTALILSACNNHEAELAKSNRQRDSILKIANQQENSLIDFMASFNEIERNLDSVSVKQHIIYANSEKGSHELKLSQKDRINSEIASINALMKQNAEKMSELQRRLKNYASKNKRLEETVITLNNQLLQKNSELISMNDRLNALDLQVAQLHTSIDSLTQQSQTKSQTISENTITMHTAYYIIGKSKDLEEAKLIDRRGGLLGIGKTEKLSENFDKNKFVRIDYTQIGTIPVNAEKIKIVTTHPVDSYTLDKDEKSRNLVKNLVITNPEKFWSASKYLVIVKS